MEGGEPMRTFNRWAESVYYILRGAGIALPPSLLLLFIYGMCLTDSTRPDYMQMKNRVLFHPLGLSVLIWMAVGGMMFGIGIAVIGGLRPFLRESSSEGFADAGGEKTEQVSERLSDSVCMVPSEGSITPVSTSTHILPADKKVSNS
jgi:hypothetical protein